MSDAGGNTGGDDNGTTPNPFIPSPDDMQHWASVMARASSAR